MIDSVKTKPKYFAEQKIRPPPSDLYLHIYLCVCVCVCVCVYLKIIEVKRVPCDIFFAWFWIPWMKLFVHAYNTFQRYKSHVRDLYLYQYIK